MLGESELAVQVIDLSLFVLIRYLLDVAVGVTDEQVTPQFSALKWLIFSTSEKRVGQDAGSNPYVRLCAHRFVIRFSLPGSSSAISPEPNPPAALGISGAANIGPSFVIRFCALSNCAVWGEVRSSISTFSIRQDPLYPLPHKALAHYHAYTSGISVQSTMRK